MNKVTVLIALMDYLPMLLFGVGTHYFLRIGFSFLSRGFYTAMDGSAILCFLGGLYKATSKLLEAVWRLEIPALQSIQGQQGPPDLLWSLALRPSCNRG